LALIGGGPPAARPSSNRAGSSGWKKLAESAAECAKLPGMDIQIAVLCDAATDQFGKLNLLGTFDTIQAPALPAIHPQCSVALRMSFNKVEEGAHKLKLNFVDEDGRPVMPDIDIPVEVAVPDDAIFISRNFIVNIQKLKFDKAGHYSINIALDGRQVGSIPLLVKHVQLTGQMPHLGQHGAND
jgi:hypothetical protein